MWLPSGDCFWALGRVASDAFLESLEALSEVLVSHAGQTLELMATALASYMPALVIHHSASFSSFFPFLFLPLSAPFATRPLLFLPPSFIFLPAFLPLHPPFPASFTAQYDGMSSP